MSEAKTDRELLDLAAKAAGISAVREFTFECDGTSSGECKSGLWNRDRGGIWNPLTDDGDALRLAVKLRLYVRYHEALGRGIVNTISGGEYEVNVEDCGQDEAAATRRAIVKAAAEIATGSK